MGEDKEATLPEPQRAELTRPRGEKAPSSSSSTCTHAGRPFCSQHSSLWKQSPSGLSVPSEKAPAAVWVRPRSVPGGGSGKTGEGARAPAAEGCPVNQVLESPAAEIGDGCHATVTQSFPEHREPPLAGPSLPMTFTHRQAPGNGSHASGVPCGPAHGLLDLARAEPGAAPSQLVDPRPLSGHTGQARLGAPPSPRPCSPPGSPAGVVFPEQTVRNVNV